MWIRRSSSDAVLSRPGPLGRLFGLAVGSGVRDDERALRMFMAGIGMCMSGRYRIADDRGDGCWVMLMERVRGPGPNVIVEVEVAGTRDPTKEWTLGKDGARGLSGRTVLYTVAFDGKTPTVTSRTLMLRRANLGTRDGSTPSPSHR